MKLSKLSSDTTFDVVGETYGRSFYLVNAHSFESVKALRAHLIEHFWAKQNLKSVVIRVYVNGKKDFVTIKRSEIKK